MTTRFQTILDFEPVVTAVHAAGCAILDVYSRTFEVDYKEDRSPLTAADRAAHEILVAALEALPEKLPVLSEESAAAPYEVRRSWSRFWLVDPLDGTKEFVKRNGEFTVNVALIEDGQPRFGIVYAPVPGDMYIGLVGAGAYKLRGDPAAAGAAHFAAALGDIEIRGRRLPLSAPAVETNAEASGAVRVVASRSHRNAETQAFIAALEARHGPVELVSIGSSLKLCLVAEGSADIYPRIAPTMEWDTGAAQAVVEAAGGRVFEYGADAPLRYNKADLLNPFFVVTGAHRQSFFTGVADGNI
jgi:3'(2'), 5'-bisphosphate nucleotidase